MPQSPENVTVPPGNTLTGAKLVTAGSPGPPVPVPGVATSPPAVTAPCAASGGDVPRPYTFAVSAPPPPGSVSVIAHSAVPMLNRMVDTVVPGTVVVSTSTFTMSV